MFSMWPYMWPFALEILDQVQQSYQMDLVEDQ
jgi:hypothetical protein